MTDRTISLNIKRTFSVVLAEQPKCQVCGKSTTKMPTNMFRRLRCQQCVWDAEAKVRKRTFK